MPPIANFVRDFRLKPESTPDHPVQGGRCWLTLKIGVTTCALFVNTIGQYWANGTIQDSMRDYGIDASATNALNLFFYPMMVALGVVYMVEPSMDLVDLIEHRAKRCPELMEKVENAFASCSKGIKATLLLGCHGAFAYCFFKLALLESNAGRDYARKPHEQDWTARTGISTLCSQKFAYPLNILANFTLYMVYGFRNTNKLSQLLGDSVDEMSCSKGVKITASLIFSGLSVAMMTYVSLNHGLGLKAFLPIFFATAQLNSVPNVLFINCADVLVRHGRRAGWTVGLRDAHTLFGAGVSKMTSFHHDGAHVFARLPPGDGGLYAAVTPPQPAGAPAF